MRHQRQRYQLSRSASHRKALLMNLCKEVIDARADPDDRGEGQGGQARGREADHARQARRPPRPPAGPVGARPGQVHRLQAVRGDRAALLRAARRLHADPEARAAALGFDRDGAAGAGLTARLDLEYDGSGFAGWARQPGARTIQEEVERALVRPAARRLRAADGGRAHRRRGSRAGAGGELRGRGRSRARAERAAARGRRRALVRRGSGRLRCPARRDIAGVLLPAAGPGGAERAGARTGCSTGPIASTSARWPRAPRRWSAPTTSPPSPRPRPSTCGSRGTCSRPTGARSGEVLEFWIEADAFMRNMNRVLVGTMLEVASGRRSVASFVSLLDGRPRPEAGPTAPP